ncbi:MAG: hypothetical protein Q4C14_06915 [Bacillota bacterium]|nr:hypothetical protein [Bacillota bacterium]
MNCNKRFTVCREDLKNCTRKIRRKCCCVSADKYREIKKLSKVMVCTGILAILILCFPPAVWFVILAIVMIVVGIKIFLI